MAKLNSGIYAIAVGTNAYIGSTTNFDRRWEQHKEKLAAGKHSSYLLQQEYDRLLPEKPTFEDFQQALRKFKFKILERCPESKLEKRERYWIAKYWEQGRSLNVVVPGHPRWNRKLRKSEEKAKTGKAKARWSDRLIWIS